MTEYKKYFPNGVLIFLFLLWIGYSARMFFGTGGTLDILSISGGKMIPDLSLYHSAEGLQDTLNSWGKQGRLYYLRYQYRDFIYPMIYSLLLVSILVRLIRPRYFNFWAIIPFFAMFYDFAENYFLRVLVYDYPNFNSDDIIYASLFTFLKWFTIAFSFMLIYIAYKKRRKEYLKHRKYEAHKVKKKKLERVAKKINKMNENV